MVWLDNYQLYHHKHPGCNASGSKKITIRQPIWTSKRLIIISCISLPWPFSRLIMYKAPFENSFLRWNANVIREKYVQIYCFCQKRNERQRAHLHIFCPNEASSGIGRTSQFCLQLSKEPDEIRGFRASLPGHCTSI